MPMAMTTMISSLLAAVLIAATATTSHAADLFDLPVLSSSNGLLDISLTLEAATHSQDGFTIRSRLINGILPGPILRIKPGDLMKINFQNKLADQGLTFTNNRLSAPDETNLHFHGMFVSGEAPSDDPKIELRPGDSYTYITSVPSDHMPGTHWFHPHRHGSTAIQVGGGAAGTIIVEDPPNYPLPTAVRDAKEVVMVVMQMDTEDLQDAVSSSRDGLVNVSGPRRRFLVTNGQINPTIRADAGQWLRLRVVFAGWVKGTLDMAVNGCEMQLLSKDGIYIRDFPRSITSAPVVPGGRADIMVRCSAASRSFPISGWQGNTIATIVTSGTTVSSSNLPSWTPPFPTYLSDLRGTAATSGCSCPTNVGDNDGVNGRQYVPGQALHISRIGAVVERRIDVENHPYHQHVYPYQFISVSETAYNKVGDWHDTVLGTAVVRHETSRFAGKVMIHW